MSRAFDSWWAKQPEEQRAAWLGEVIAAQDPVRRQSLVTVPEARLVTELREELIGATGWTEAEPLNSDQLMRVWERARRLRCGTKPRVISPLARQLYVILQRVRRDGRASFVVPLAQLGQELGLADAVADPVQWRHFLQRAHAELRAAGVVSRVEDLGDTISYHFR